MAATTTYGAFAAGPRTQRDRLRALGKDLRFAAGVLLDAARGR